MSECSGNAQGREGVAMATSPKGLCTAALPEEGLKGKAACKCNQGMGPHVLWDTQRPCRPG